LIAERGVTALRQQTDGQGLELHRDGVDVELRSIEPYAGGWVRKNREGHRDLL
jgi:hypothetical protein